MHEDFSIGNGHGAFQSSMGLMHFNYSESGFLFHFNPLLGLKVLDSRRSGYDTPKPRMNGVRGMLKPLSSQVGHEHFARLPSWSFLGE